jgi:hypothetical protein
MMIFDLINMSDQYTFAADDLECAALTTILLGSGQYSAKQICGDATVPFFMFGGHDEWFMDNFGRGLEASVALFRGARACELIACLESVVIGDREEYERTLAMIPTDKKVEWIAAWNDKRRSSLNDIGARAKRIASALTEQTIPERAPQQVFAGL